MKRKIIYLKSSEEYEAIKLLEKMTKNYSLNCKKLHYVIILYNLIINLQDNNQKLREKIKYLERSNNRRESTILELREEITERDEKINKAIEYIEKTKERRYLLLQEMSVLDILKGENINERI